MVLKHHVLYNVETEKQSCFFQLMDIQEKLALNLRRIRVAKNISQDELALRSGVERAYVGHIERGTKNPTIKTIEKLSNALECAASELLLDIQQEQVNGSTLARGRKAKA